jgi:hypothetical protein
MSIPPPRRKVPRNRRLRPDRPGLRFRRDGRFTIVQLTDLHWSNGDGADARTRALVDEVLRAERPDLVALTGDVVSGSEAKDPCRAWHEVADLVEAHGAPWAAVFGNHDHEGRATREQMLRAQRRRRLCLTRRGPRDVTGVGNYVLRVRSSRSRKLAAALYFLDSGAYDDLGVGSYAWIARDQIAWYLKTSSRLGREFAKPSFKLPALAFFHIPLPEWDEVWRTQVCRGRRHEPVCSPAVNSGFFAALVEAGDVMGAFCGHDHVNDYEGTLHGIRLGYGRATGFGEYGRKGFPRGARVFRLREGERQFETWVRVEGGRVVRPPVHRPRSTGH